MSKITRRPDLYCPRCHRHIIPQLCAASMEGILLSCPECGHFWHPHAYKTKGPMSESTTNETAAVGPETNNGESCATCRYWKALPGYEPKGLCRRGPPVRNGTNEESLFPVISAKAWCGEYAPAPARRGPLNLDAVVRAEIEAERKRCAAIAHPRDITHLLPVSAEQWDKRGLVREVCHRIAVAILAPPG